MPPKVSQMDLAPVSLTTRQIQAKMNAAKRRQQEAAARAQALRDETAMLEASEKERLHGKNPSTYIGTIMISLIFLSLPMCEPQIDWFLVSVYVFYAILWNLFFHQHSKIHYTLYFLVNVLIAQFSELIYRLPHILKNISPTKYFIIVVSNLAFNLIFHKFYRAKALTKTQYNDWVSAGHICLNAVLFLLSGAIPKEVFLVLGYSLVDFLKSFGPPSN